MTVPARSLSEINDQAVRLLIKEMGPADAARFINQFTSGQGNYTDERKALFDDLSVEDIVRQIEDRRTQG